MTNPQTFVCKRRCSVAIIAAMGTIIRSDALLWTTRVLRTEQSGATSPSLMVTSPWASEEEAALADESDRKEAGHIQR